jgi:hypothetical protein
MKLGPLFLFAATCAAGDFTERGFLEVQGDFYPRAALNDSGHEVGEASFRYETFYKPVPFLQFSAGIDANTDSHRQVERRLHLSLWDRERLRPALALREASITLSAKKLTLQIGKQFIRWGKADVLNPTDRFAPRDYLNVVENDFLAVGAARLTYGSTSDTLDLVWEPRFTPSRMPLLNQRWTVLPAGISVQELFPDYPGGSQFGARWNHVARLAEFSISAFDGFNHLPSIRGTAEGFQRFYPRIRAYGVDMAVPLKWITFRGETEYFRAHNSQADEYWLYVAQLERQSGEWFFTAGYTGQAIVRQRSPADFNPERGLARAFVAHAGYTIDTNRSVNFEAIVRQNGRGEWVKAEYSQAFGQHWRATITLGLIRGEPDDFLGQYWRNSYGILWFRYSF